jgi:hypothetical protein
MGFTKRVDSEVFGRKEITGVGKAVHKHMMPSILQLTKQWQRWVDVPASAVKKDANPEFLDACFSPLLAPVREV